MKGSMHSIRSFCVLPETPVKTKLYSRKRKQTNYAALQLQTRPQKCPFSELDKKNKKLLPLVDEDLKLLVSLGLIPLQMPDIEALKPFEIH